MLIKDFRTCQERLPGMPGIGVEPGCALTSMEKPCEHPTYDTCPRYEWVEMECPACQEVMEGPTQMVRDMVDWTLICPECGLEVLASSTKAQLDSFWPQKATG